MSWEYSKYEARCEAAAKKVSVFAVRMIGTAHQRLGKALTASHPSRLRWVEKEQTHEIKWGFVIVAIQRSWSANISERLSDGRD